MSKIVGRLLENVEWLHNLSSILTVFFVIMFILLIVDVLRMKKEDIEEYKNIPLSKEDDSEIL